MGSLSSALGPIPEGGKQFNPSGNGGKQTRFALRSNR